MSLRPAPAMWPRQLGSLWGTVLPTPPEYISDSGFVCRSQGAISVPVTSDAEWYFRNGTIWPAGEYLVLYAAGAIDYLGATRPPPPQYVVSPATVGIGPEILYDGAAQEKAPGDNAVFSTVAAAEANSAFAYSLITTTTNDRIGIWISDTLYTDNTGEPLVYGLYARAYVPRVTTDTKTRYTTDGKRRVI